MTQDNKFKPGDIVFLTSRNDKRNNSIVYHEILEFAGYCITNRNTKYNMSLVLNSDKLETAKVYKVKEFIRLAKSRDKEDYLSDEGLILTLGHNEPILSAVYPLVYESDINEAPEIINILYKDRKELEDGSEKA